MKYPEYFELSLLEGIKAFFAEDPLKKKSFLFDQSKKGLFEISFRMTNQGGRMEPVYKCVGFYKKWNGDKIDKIMFKKVKETK